MNSAVCFSDFTKVHSLIVTSGTLSPMSSFESELGLAFPVAFEANHVIKKSQAWVGTVSCGPSSIPLKAVYQSTETLEFQDELGKVVLQVCQAVPHGVLCFFPSYSNLEKMKLRWELTGLWDKLEGIKFLAVEPRGSNKIQFEEILHGFYSVIEEGSGALFLAVYRGKVSEGMNFSDNNARAVITIGIPYPNFKDIKVDLKQKYNNIHCRTRQLMNGRQWYEAQAFRALNQALGRCIRHRADWGALILVDQRFQTNVSYVKSLSKWVRNELQHYETFCEAMDSLTFFAKNAQSTIDPRLLKVVSYTPLKYAEYSASTPVKFPQYTSCSSSSGIHCSTPMNSSSATVLLPIDGTQNNSIGSTNISSMTPRNKNASAGVPLSETLENVPPDYQLGKLAEEIDLCSSPELF